MLKYWFFSAYAIIHTFLYKLRHTVPYSDAEKDVFIHIPKTAGQSLASSMGLVYHGHTKPSQDFLRRTDVNFYVVLRDPVDRFKSIFKYSRKASQIKPTSPLYPLVFFDDINEFVCSEAFRAFVKHHYFFRPVTDYVTKDNLIQDNFNVIKFDRIDEDFNRYFNKPLPVVNKSPNLHGNDSLSDQSEGIVAAAYCEDIALVESVGVGNLN